MQARLENDGNCQQLIKKLKLRDYPYFEERNANLYEMKERLKYFKFEYE
jgi:hypothetical protein